jgi:hypothetical protein
MVLQQFIPSPKKFSRRCATEVRISTSRVHRILKTAKCKCYVPCSLHAVTEDDPDHRLEFCECIRRKVSEDVQFPDISVGLMRRRLS